MFGYLPIITHGIATVGACAIIDMRVTIDTNAGIRLYVRAFVCARPLARFCYTRPILRIQVDSNGFSGF